MEKSSASKSFRHSNDVKVTLAVMVGNTGISENKDTHTHTTEHVQIKVKRFEQHLWIDKIKVNKLGRKKDRH